MTKTIFGTGSTDGIGLLTAKQLAAAGHTVLLHGRSWEKLDKAISEVGGNSRGYVADLTKADEVKALRGTI